MTRHSRNCTANAVYSYHEKRKDGSASGFGSLKQRFAKDAVKDFDCCCLSLHPCREPLLSRDGYLFDKESVLEFIVAKKRENARKMKEYEKQCLKEKTELQELGELEQKLKLEKFLKLEGSVRAASQAAQASVRTSSQASSSSNASSNGESSKSMLNTSNENKKKLASFWIPSLTPASKESKKGKPDKTVYCPMSGKPLRLKDLIPVKFTRMNGDQSLESTTERYKCPVTGDLLGNNVPCALITSTGDVVTMDCVELIKKDLIHPLTNEKISLKDIIPLQRGGTGFSKINNVLVAKKARPVLQV